MWIIIYLQSRFVPCRRFQYRHSRIWSLTVCSCLHCCRGMQHRCLHTPILLLKRKRGLAIRFHYSIARVSYQIPL